MEEDSISLNLILLDACTTQRTCLTDFSHLGYLVEILNQSKTSNRLPSYEEKKKEDLEFVKIND